MTTASSPEAATPLKDDLAPASPVPSMQVVPGSLHSASSSCQGAALSPCRRGLRRVAAVGLRRAGTLPSLHRRGAAFVAYAILTAGFSIDLAGYELLALSAFFLCFTSDFWGQF